MLGSLAYSMALTGGAAAAAAAAKTYAEYQAQIATLATSGAKTWTTAANLAGSFRTTVGAQSGGLGGSPWSSSFVKGADAGSTSSASVARIVLHALPSAAEATAQEAGGREVFIKMTATTSGAVTGLNRNGYTSFTDAGPYNLMICDDLIYWDGAAAQRMNPSTGTGPTPYTW